jgi:hypothetical protein
VKHIATVCTVEEALRAIDSHNGLPAEFVLRIAHSAIGPIEVGGRVITGTQMAVIGDRVLSRNWCPKGFEEDGDHRLYFYGDW